MQKDRHCYLKPYDIIVYALIVVLFVLSCVFVSTFSQEDGENFELVFKGKVILQACFSGFVEYDEDYITKKSDNEYEVITECGMNLLKIDFSTKNARFIQSDCHGEECLAMNLKSGGIVCAPHSLVLRYKNDYGPVVG